MQVESLIPDTWVSLDDENGLNSSHHDGHASRQKILIDEHRNDAVC